MPRRTRKNLLLEQVFERRLRSLYLGGVLCYEGPWFRLEVVAEVGLVLFANLLNGWFAALVRVARVVFDAHLANVQLCITCLAHIQTAQRQAKVS